MKAQIPPEAFPLTNSLSGLWHNGQTEKAIQNSLKLCKLYPPMFIDNIHNTLAQILQDENSSKNGHIYLENLYLQKDTLINNIITPIYIWSRIIHSKDHKEINNALNDLTKTVTDSSNHISRAERYVLLILKGVEKDNIVDLKTKESLLLRVINNLESYPYLNVMVSDLKLMETRAWNRYLLAYGYNYLYSNFYQKEEYLRKASNYSPDACDNLVKYAYFYDATLLTNNTYDIGFKQKYFDYLKNKNKKEALNLLTEITFNEPTDANLANLKSYFSEISIDQPFEEYWLNYINSKCKDSPKVKIEYPNEVLDLTQKNDTWIYIDVWGTWCRPCREELPQLQAFFVENNKRDHLQLKIYTFSFASQNLATFMDKNKYTFPVSEIDQKVNDMFEVSGYPTKILITPDGKYLKIPFAVDWKMYLKNYILL